MSKSPKKNNKSKKNQNDSNGVQRRQRRVRGCGVYGPKPQIIYGFRGRMMSTYIFLVLNEREFLFYLLK